MTKPDVKKDGTPIHRCGATTNGPKVGRHVVLWRKQCRIIVKNEGDRCRFHPLRERIGRKLEECEVFDLIQQTPVGQWEATTGVPLTDITPGATFTVDDDLRMWGAGR